MISYLVWDGSRGRVSGRGIYQSAKRRTEEKRRREKALGVEIKYGLYIFIYRSIDVYTNPYSIVGMV